MNETVFTKHQKLIYIITTHRCIFELSMNGRQQCGVNIHKFKCDEYLSRNR